VRRIVVAALVAAALSRLLSAAPARIAQPTCVYTDPVTVLGQPILPAGQHCLPTA
jgi:hypothetical protein